MKIENLNKYIQLYDIEKYLFAVIGPKVQARGYLIFDEFYQICMWKSARQKPRYIENKNRVEEISRKVFSEKDEAIKIEMLCKLNGVGIPTASAILTIVFPKEYAVIDIRCLEILHGKFSQNIGRSMSVKTWLNYLTLMRSWAKENNITPRELDMAFFAMHKEKLEEENNRNLYKK